MHQAIAGLQTLSRVAETMAAMVCIYQLSNGVSCADGIVKPGESHYLYQQLQKPFDEDSTCFAHWRLLIITISVLSILIHPRPDLLCNSN